MRRQAERQIGIEQRDVGNEQRRDDALLLVRAGGDDGDRRHLRAGAGRRRHERAAAGAGPSRCRRRRYRQASSPLRSKQRHELGDIERRAAAEADRRPRASKARARRDGREHHGLRRIGHDAVEDLDGDAGVFEGGERRRDEPGLDETGIGDEDHPGAEPLRRDLAEPRDAAGAEDDDGMVLKVKGDMGAAVHSGGRVTPAGRQGSTAGAQLIA